MTILVTIPLSAHPLSQDQHPGTRGRVDFIVYSVAWHLAFTVLFACWDVGLGRWWLVAFFLATALRAWLVPSLGVMRGRPVSARSLGMWEVVTTLILAVVLVPALIG